MSAEKSGVSVNTFCGPETDDGTSRTMVQITAGGKWVQMTLAGWVDLAAYIRWLDAGGIGITESPTVRFD